MSIKYRNLSALLSFCLSLTSFSALALEPSSSARIIPLSETAWAASSVNVLANTRQTLFTDSATQYAAYYDDKAYLTLAKRRIGEDTWVTHKTAYQANAQDAHNHISLVVDGNGFLHVAWDHHNNPLHYAHSKAAGSLELAAPTNMVNRDEGSVTYPQFYRMQDGNLLFQYRDGGSGNGQLVINRFNIKTKRWERLHNSLIDGEGQRSAYWDMTLDKQGVLHLTWIWRETPDVATNHDLAYARSADGGNTWTRLNGDAYQLPITQKSADYALKIPQQSNLMNPPVIAADNKSRPFIASYWSSTKTAVPRFQIIYADENKWHLITGPEAGIHFSLSGTGTKRPPISRATLLVENNREESWLHLIYRDDSRGGRIIAASVNQLQNPVWSEHFLTQDSVGAWEPSIDPVQWSHMGQAQMLVQQVQQIDGNDSESANTKTSPLGVLIWSPNWDRHQALQPTN